MKEIGNWHGQTHFDIPGPDGPVRVSVIEDGRLYQRRKRAEMKTGTIGKDEKDAKKKSRPLPPKK